MQRLISQIGRSQRLAVVNLLKRNTGLTVREMAGRLDMSYMGVKQICLGLQKSGYLDARPRHRGVGRPELVYRLTNKAQDLFPQADNSLVLSLLAEARKLFGAMAAEKLLFRHFQSQTADYAQRVQGDTPVERGKWFARLREREGYMADFDDGPPARIVERHHPMLAVLRAYPETAAMERDMFQRVIGAPVRRESLGGEGEYECAFVIG